MMPALPRVRGDGWMVWVDEEGLLWTRGTSPQNGSTAAARVAAMRRLLVTHPARAVIVDDRQHAGGDTPAAREAHTAFLAAHPHLPVAVVTTHPSTAELVREVRARTGSANLGFFKSLPAAKGWLRTLGDGHGAN